MTNSPHETQSECLKLLINRMSEIQSSLPAKFCSDLIFRDKLLKKDCDVIDCRLTYQNRTNAVSGVISKLRALLATRKRATANSSNVSSKLENDYADRQYVLHHPNARSDNRKNRDCKCFVCGQIFCWSTNHSTKELFDAVRKNKSICQFMTSFKEEDDETDDDNHQLADVLKDVTAKVVEINLKDDEDNDRMVLCTSICHTMKISTILQCSLRHYRKPQSFGPHCQNADLVLSEHVLRCDFRYRLYLWERWRTNKVFGILQGNWLQPSSTYVTGKEFPVWRWFGDVRR